ncbi:DUF2079 domain-containing protein [Streptococcus ferus]|uniref:DUF2079 domain-containing protein n=1 Tax=Streptococcus ferus TaxID=1345 RepID=UPI0035A06DBA
MTFFKHVSQKWVPEGLNQILLYLINAYLLYAIFNLIQLPAETLFIHLGNHGLPFLSLILALFILVVGQILLGKKWKLSIFQQLATVLMAAYLFIAIYKSPSLLITFSLFILGFAVYFKLYVDQMKFRQLLPAVFLALFPKVIYSIYHTYPGDLGKFAIKLDNWNTNHIWILLFAFLYALLLGFLLTHFIGKKISIRQAAKQTKLAYAIVGLLGLTYVIYLCIISVYKVKTLSVSTFDIGIFTQMFASMRDNLTPMTTLERDRLLSHFAVHISPIYYLMLPFYYFLPYLETLEVLQILVVFSGVIPLALIIKKLQLPKYIRPFLLLWFFVTPAFTTAGSYHLHENCFLVPLLLWLIYANMSQWKWRLLLFVALTLMVKEDAFIYVVSVGLYFLIQNYRTSPKRTSLFTFLSQIIFPILYFSACVYLLSKYGEGAMVSRFDNFLLSGQKGLFKVIQNILLNPTFTFVSLFTQNKLKYLFLLLLSQAFLPLMQRKWHHYLLFIPLVVINLLSDYPYQADFGFQYSYGTNTLILFTSLLALEGFYQAETTAEIAQKMKTGIICTATAFSIVMSSAILYSFTNNWYADTLTYFNQKETYTSIHKTLGAIDTNQRILAYSAYTVDLRETKELYDLFYHNQQNVDKTIDLLVIPKSTFEGSSIEAEVAKKYLTAGYAISDDSTEHVLIIKPAIP